MMKSKLMMTVIIIGALVIGFALGQVQAVPFAPGSEEDPLVAKSYLDEQLQQHISELEQEIALLTEKAAELQAVVDELSRKMGN